MACLPVVSKLSILTWLCVKFLEQAVIQADIFSPLVELLQHAEFEIKKEAAWAISNATSGGSPEQIRYMDLMTHYV